MRAQDVVIDAAKTLGTPILTAVNPIYEYSDGKKASDTPIGYRYTVASSITLEKIGIRIDGPQQLEMPSGLEKVQFNGLQLKVYLDTRSNSVMVSGRAEGISLLNTDKQHKA